MSSQGYPNGDGVEDCSPYTQGEDVNPGDWPVGIAVKGGGGYY